MVQSLEVIATDGIHFSTDPKSLEMVRGGKFIDYLNSYVPLEGSIVNNIEYDSEAASFFRSVLTPKQLETLYYVSLGLEDEAVAQIRNVTPNSLKQYMSTINRKLKDVLQDQDPRIGSIISYQSAFPHLFPELENTFVELTSKGYIIANLIGEGRTDTYIAAQLAIVEEEVEWHIEQIYGSISSLVSPQDHLRSKVAILARRGMFKEPSVQGQEFDVCVYFVSKIDDWVNGEPDDTLADYLNQTLSYQELKVLSFLAVGLNNESIAEWTSMNGRIVGRHIRNMNYKFGPVPEGFDRRTSSSIIYHMAHPKVDPIGDVLDTDGQLDEEEFQVAQLIGRGYNNESISSKLLMEPRTVENHITNINTQVAPLNSESFSLRVWVSNLVNWGYLSVWN